MTTSSTCRSTVLRCILAFHLLLPTVHSYPKLTVPLQTYTSILRSFHRPDTIFVKNCPTSCADQFHALELNNSTSECSCICPKDAPAFLPSTGFCVRQLDECAHPIAFNTSNRHERFLPVLSFPATNSAIAPNTRILFHEANVRINRQGADCQVASVYYLDDEDLWTEFQSDLFYLQLSNGYKKLFWNGTAEDAKRFLGTIVQIKLKCAPYNDARHCLSFRLPGEKEILFGARGKDNAPPRLEVFVIIVLSLLLLVSIFTSIILWRVCWKMKKSELISAIQIQFMYHLNHEKQQAAQAARNAAAQSNGQCAAGQSPPHQQGVSSSCASDGISSDQSNAQPVQKRKLFFSAEFFEPHLMADPPPVAEQFLADLRKMIDIAKSRLRMKRHVPTLVSIPEEPPFVTPELTLSAPNDETQAESESSPKSVKSIDSGKDSMNTSSDSDPEMRRAAESAAKVKKIVNGFEQRTNGAVKSRIPVIGTRSPSKPPSPPVVHSNGIAPHPPPQRPAPPTPTEDNSAPIPPPLPATDPPPRPAVKGMRRKAYAVFPGDSMLKKSLPRRSKKNKPLGSSGLIETNM